MTDERVPVFGDPDLPPEEAAPSDEERHRLALETDQGVRRAEEAARNQPPMTADPPIIDPANEEQPTREDMDAALALAAARNGPTINTGNPVTVTIMDGEGVPAGAPTQAEMQQMRREAIENDAAHDDPAVQAVHLEHQLETQFATHPEDPAEQAANFEAQYDRQPDAAPTPTLDEMARRESGLDPTIIRGDRVAEFQTTRQWVVPEDRIQDDVEPDTEPRPDLRQWTNTVLSNESNSSSVAPRIRIRRAGHSEQESFGHTLNRLDPNTAYRIDALTRSQLDTLTLHGVHATILQQPDVEPDADDPCFTIMVGQNVLDVIQRRLQIIFTGYAAINDIEGVMGLNWAPYTWPPLPGDDGRAMADPPEVDETDELDGTRATAVILDDVADDRPDPVATAVPPLPEGGLPDLPEQPVDHAQQELFRDFPLRRPLDLPPAGTAPAFVNFTQEINQALIDAEYAEITTFNEIVMEALGRNRHLRPFHCLIDDVWSQVDGLEVPANLNQVEDEFNSYADDGEYEEIERRACVYCYTGHFSMDDIEALLSEYDIETPMPEALPFYYYNYVLMCFSGVYNRAQELGMIMLTNRFINIAAEVFGDDLSAASMNAIMRNVVPLQADMHAIPQLDPEPAPEPTDRRRLPRTIDPLWDNAVASFISRWNLLLAGSSDEELDTAHDLYQGKFNSPDELADYTWPEEWFPGLTTDVDEAASRAERYMSEGNPEYVLPYFNMLAGIGFVDELELDAILEREEMDVTEIGQQALYMFPVIKQMYSGNYLEAAQNAVKMLSCPFTELIADHLGEDLSAGEMNITMRLLTDQPNNLFPVQMNETPGQAPSYTVGSTPLSRETRIAALHAAAAEPKPKKEEDTGPKVLEEGRVIFSSVKSPIHREYQDEDTDYFQLAEDIAQSLGINIAFISRDAPNVKPYEKGTKRHRLVGGRYVDYNPAILPELKDGGMVKDNTLYIHVYARPHNSIVIKKLTAMPDEIVLDRNFTGEGDPIPWKVNQMTYGDSFVEAKFIRYSPMSKTKPDGEKMPSPPCLRADFRMDGSRTWGGVRSGDMTIARFTDPQNVFVNFQMLRYDSEAGFLMYEHVMNWIRKMVYFDAEEVHGHLGLVISGTMRWTEAAQKYIANDEQRLYEKRVNNYIKSFKTSVIGDLKALEERLDKIQSEILSLTTSLVMKGKEQQSTNDRIVGLRKKDGEFSKTLRAEIDAISEMEGIRSFKILPDGLKAESEYLLLHDERTDDWYKLGQISITLLNKGELKMINNTRQCEGLKLKMNHPHVYPNGGACLGDLTKTIPNYFSTASISALVDIALQLLVNVNSADTAGAYVTKWPKCEPELQKFLNETFKSKFQAGRIGYAAYKQHLIDKEKKANVSKPIPYGTPAAGGSGFPSDEELEAAAYIDATGNITPGQGHSGQTPAGGSDPGAPSAGNSGIQISDDGQIRAAAARPRPRGQLLPDDGYTGTDG